MERNRRLGMVITVAVLLVILLITAGYSRFVSWQILEESAGHLKEVYAQINVTFRSTITKNWRLLRSWRNYIARTADSAPDELAAFIQEEQEAWHFTTFYFLAPDGSFRTVQGETGRLDLGEALTQLVEAQEDVAADVPLPDGLSLVFAVPTEAGTYQGFDYTAIGLGFNVADMTGSLNIRAFSGQSDCYVIRPDGQVLFSSESGEEKQEDFLSYVRDYGDFSDISPEEIAQDWQDGVPRVIACGLEGKASYLCYQPVGFSDWVLVSTAPEEVVNTGMGRFTLVTLVVICLLFGLVALSIALSLIRINRRRIGEKDRELRSRENLFNLLTGNTDDIFILFSPESFRADYVSPNLERVLGMRPEEVEPDVRHLLFGDGDQMFCDYQPELTPESLAEIPLGGVWSGERDILHARTHELRWFKQLLHHCSLEGREQFILMLSDRTKERQMNEALVEALNTAKAANEAKSNFLANMSHDIRTPMNAIVGFSVLLGRDADDPEKVREHTRKITASSQHLLSLINDILDMSKIESGKTSLNISEFSLPQFMDELHTMILPQARAKGQRIELYTRGALPESLLGDKLRLSQVMINLLSNAVKYTQEGGEIALTVCGLDQNAANRAHLRFIVADNGYGMSEGFLQTIFDPFSREVSDATRGIQGTGLGMAITKNIVDLMGGTIHVQSETGRGSTFTVEVELAIADPTEDRAFWTSRSLTRLLVVDDEEEVCQGIRQAMEDTGVDVSWATDGNTAVELAAAARARGQGFHIILLDWKMPGMDGLETARRIRAQVGPYVPIFVLTAYDLDAAQEAGVQAGIDLFLPKPFFRASLERAVAQHLDSGTPAERSGVAQTAISLKGLNVLAAEDNEINAEILVELLEIEGVRCEVVPDGREAVERFAQSAPGEFDMIFMDVQMPVMDGYEATRAIRAGGHPEAKTIPIIAMTANAFEEDIQLALAAGMSAHTAKPLDMEKLKEIVGTLINP